MNIVRENISFERGLDPKRAMKIGFKKWEDLKEGDFLKAKYQIPLDSYENFSQYGYHWIPEGTYLYIKKLNKWHKENLLFMRIDYKGFDDLKEVQYFLKEPTVVSVIGATKGTIRQWKNRFNIVQIWELNESQNFERGRDPKETMGIGMKILQLANKTGMTLSELRLTRDRLRSWLNLSALTIIGFPYFLTFIKEWYEDPEAYDINKNSPLYDDVIWAKYHPKDAFELVMLKDSEIMYENVNFERGKDPKVSMNIGKRVQIENWLKKYDLFEDCIINKDLTIDSPAEVNLFVDLHNKELIELPKYIQFRKVYGGFNIGKNQLTSLRGCPIQVLETDNLKGNFKCHSNQLTSLEFAPKRIDGNFICYGNPGKFKRSDVTKVCKVKSGKIWGDEPTGYVKEDLEFQRGDFLRGEDPLDSMQIGRNYQIKEWLKKAGLEEDEYGINADGTIDLYQDINIVGMHLEELPEYINFNKSFADFYAAHNRWKSLRGFPKDVLGDFSIYSEYDKEPNFKKWTEDEIKEKITVHGIIYC